jgi:hypothetical protein
MFLFDFFIILHCKIIVVIKNTHNIIKLYKLFNLLNTFCCANRLILQQHIIIIYVKICRIRLNQVSKL